MTGRDAAAAAALSSVTGDSSIADTIGRVTTPLVLSLFPGVDLLGRGFDAEGFVVVRGPDLIWGGDVRDFHAPAGRFDGVIGGSPCQDFSKLNRTPGDNSIEMLAEFGRVVAEAGPLWWLLENVPQVPDLYVAGYSHQRFDIHAGEVGMSQNRLRHFQFGHRDGLVLSLPRPRRRAAGDRCVVATGDRRSWRDLCRLQGLPDDFDLPGMTKAGKYRAVGNGVPVPMARFVAAAIWHPVDPSVVRLCVCGCGRPPEGQAQSAGPACRKRLQRARSVNARAFLYIDESQTVTDQGPLFAGPSPVTRPAELAGAGSQNSQRVG